MSTRWYPLYQKGNPQLRVFLPNFWMKLVKFPLEPVPKNRVMFHVSMGMSSQDVKHYLESIYKVPVVNVRTYIRLGDTRIADGAGYVVKDDDYKVAVVSLPKETKFEYPDIYPEQKLSQDLEEEQKNMQQLQDAHSQLKNKIKYKPDLPGWFA